MRSCVLAFVAASAVLTACAKQPVDWSDVRYPLAGAAGTASVASAAAADSSVLDSESAALPIPDPARCPKSIRIARAEKSFFAVWWSVRKDSSAVLLTSRSDDGGAWTEPVAADTSDASGRGCARPAPSIAADVASGYVHIGYFAEPSQGAGAFYVHSMDRGESFHAPVAMVFGSRPANTAVTAEGDRVAVAYEDPNSSRPRIFVGLSKTMGHIFELKVPVSDDNAAAVLPTAHLRGTKLVVGWTEIDPSDSTRRRQASRTGTWK
jgi:hypothetical protein